MHNNRRYSTRCIDRWNGSAWDRPQLPAHRNRGCFAASFLVSITIFTLVVSSFGFNPPNAAGTRPAKSAKSGQAAADPLPSAPDFRLKDTFGRTVQLSDFAGKIVIVNFWATWCEPCKAEIPSLTAAQKTYGSRGVQIIGIAVNDTRKAVEQFAKDNKINYPLLLGDFATIDSYSALANAITGVPETFYVNRNGKVANQHLGPLTRADLEQDIKTALER